MSLQYYGRYTALDPAIVIGGFTAGGAVQFNAEPFNIVNPAVVSGTLHAISGTTSKTLTFDRADQLFSFTDSFGDEIQYRSSMGGNIVQTAECERGYSHLNDRSFRGSDALDRCEPGDVAWFNGKGFLITAATPFASAPTSTNWGADATATVWTYDAAINNVALPLADYPGNPAATIVFDDSTTALWGGAKLQIDDTGWVDCERVIFDRPSDSTPDPSYYPDDAEFSTSPTAAEYWFDPFGNRFRLASHNDAVGENYRATYWVRGLEQWAALATTEVWGIENTDNADGFANSGTTNEDFLVMAATRAEGSFNQTFRVYKRGTVYGDLAIIWRQSAEIDSAMVAVEMDNDTPVGIHTRTAAGSYSYSAFTPGPGFPPVMTGDYYDINLTFASNQFSCEITDEGGSPVTLFGGASLSGITSANSGWVGIATWGNEGVHFSGFAVGVDTFLVRVEAAGRFGLRIDDYQGSGWTGVEYSATVAKKTAEAVTGVTNITANSIAMTDSATERRDTYDLTGSTFTFYSESSGDQIRIEEAPPASPPGGIGRGPQVPNTVNFYDPDDSATSKNRANWRDQIVIHDPEEEFDAVVGNTVEIKRNAVFDSTTPPSLSYSYFDNVSATWTAMTPGTDYIGRWAEGLVLISATFLAGLAGAEEQLCIRAEGVRILHNGSQTARQFNDMAAALDAFDELYANIGSGGGPGIACHGGGQIEGGPGDYSCDIVLECFVPGDFVWGATPNQMNAGAPYPQWVSGTKKYASQSYDPSPGTETCGAASLDLAGVGVEGLFQYTINPNITNPSITEAIYFGSTVLPPSIATEVSFGFSFSVPGLTLNNVIAGLPDGAECVEAYITARFSGIVRNTTSVEYETRTIAGMSTISNVTTTTNQTDADLTVAVVLARRDDVQVLDADGDPLTINDYDFKFVGSGNTITVPDDEWARINVTEAVNGLIANRDSRYPLVLLMPALAPIPESVDGLKGYLLSLIPSYSGEITDVDDCNFDYRWTATATEVYADSMEFGAILARFRLPDGSLTPVIPIINPPHMPE